MNRTKLNPSRYEVVLFESGKLVKTIKCTDDLSDALELVTEINGEHNRGERTDYARLFDLSRRP